MNSERLLSHDETSKLYKYSKLRYPKSIRIIILEPAIMYPDPLRCRFEQDTYVELEAKYEAISYTWGENERSYPLYLGNNRHVLITHNLNRVLRRLRYPEKRRRIWVDAVCIDQDNDEEKAHQIPLMVDIFRSASRVIAWLDSDGAGTEGITALQHWSRHRGKAINQMQPQSLVAQATLDEGANNTLPLRLRTIESVQLLLQLPWFNRLWIIQEVVFNLDITLMADNLELSWVRFVGALHSLRDQTAEDIGSFGQAYGAIQLVVDLWKYNSGFQQVEASEQRLGMLRLLTAFQRHGCADDRDRLFALYSMANDILPTSSLPSANKIYMDIDYGSDVKIVFKKFALACMIRDAHKPAKESSIYNLQDFSIQDGDPTILKAALERQFSGYAEDWPTWVPDWSKGPTVHQLMLDNIDLNFQGSSTDDEIMVSTTCIIWENTDSDLIATRLPVISTMFDPPRNLPPLPPRSEGTDFKYLDSARELSAILEMYNGLQNRCLKGAVDAPEFICELLSTVWPPPRNIDIVNDYLHDQTGSSRLEFSKYLSNATKNARFFLASMNGARFLGFGVRHLKTGDSLIPFHTSTPRMTRTFDENPSSNIFYYSDEAASYQPKMKTLSWEVQELHHALIMRPVTGRHEVLTYRLVGTACLVGPFWTEGGRHSNRAGRFDTLHFCLV
jgi:hypothetical protein